MVGTTAPEKTGLVIGLREAVEADLNPGKPVS